MSRRQRRREQLEHAELLIEDLAHDGRGVARLDGKTVFVADALPGERVRVTRPRVRKDHDEVATEEVLTASKDRVSPRCPHFGVCGGCSLQHMAPDAQTRAKQRQLLSALRRIGGVEPARELEPLTGPVWEYRRRARLSVKDVPGKGRVLVGFRERRSPLVADMDSCEILAGGVGRLIRPLSELIGGLSIRHALPQIEVAAGDEDLALVFRVLEAPSSEDMDRFRRFAREHGLRVFLQPAGPDSVYPLDGDGSTDQRLSYALPGEDVRIRFLPTDFIQINGDLNRDMVRHALGLLDLSPGMRVLDLFAGLGNFSLPLARRGAEVVGVEGDAGLVQRARKNAAENGLSGPRFHSADLSRDWRSAPWAGLRYDRVLLDPPRAGARAIVEDIRRLGAERIVYVSCHPGTLARDAGILDRAQGYGLTAAGIMDMFPHTGHVESIAVFDAR